LDPLIKSQLRITRNQWWFSESATGPVLCTSMACAASENRLAGDLQAHDPSRQSGSGATSAPEERYLNRAQLRALIPASDMTLWRWQRNPKVSFPASVKLGEDGRNYWWVPDVRNWMRARRGIRRNWRENRRRGPNAALCLEQRNREFGNPGIDRDSSGLVVIDIDVARLAEIGFNQLAQLGQAAFPEMPDRGYRQRHLRGRCPRGRRLGYAPIVSALTTVAYLFRPLPTRHRCTGWRTTRDLQGRGASDRRVGLRGRYAAAVGVQ
jgi:hypothetical protein